MKTEPNQALQTMTTAVTCRAYARPDALGNPFIHYRLGQCQFEIGNLDRAADELMRAYMGAGPEIFDQGDPKFLRFLVTRAKDIDTSRLDKRWWQFWK